MQFLFGFLSRLFVVLIISFLPLHALAVKKHTTRLINGDISRTYLQITQDNNLLSIQPEELIPESPETSNLSPVEQLIYDYLLSSEVVTTEKPNENWYVESNKIPAIWFLYYMEDTPYSLINDIPSADNQLYIPEFFGETIVRFVDSAKTGNHDILIWIEIKTSSGVYPLTVSFAFQGFCYKMLLYDGHCSSSKGLTHIAESIAYDLQEKDSRAPVTRSKVPTLFLPNVADQKSHFEASPVFQLPIKSVVHKKKS